MKCDVVQKEIYLFRELKETEQNQVLEHVRQCPACQKLFDSVENMNALVKRAAHTTIEPVDSFRLTHRIMNRIKQASHQPTFLDKLLGYIEIKQVKWSMSVISVTLISFLTLEQVRPTQNSNSFSISATQVTHAAILDTQNFKDELQKHRTAQKVTQMNSCPEPENLKSTNIACIRQRLIRIKTF